MNLIPFLFTTLLSTCILIASVYLIKDQWAKITLTLSQFLLFVNSGIAAAYNEVSFEFAMYHYLFLISYVISFIIFWKLSEKWTLILTNKLNINVNYKFNEKIILIGFSTYYLMLFISLIYPEFKITNLFELRPPDIKTWFSERFEEHHTDAIQSAIGYIKILLFPFFFAYLYKFRDKPAHITFFFILTLYLEYADKQYISRGNVLLYTLTAAIFYYHYYPNIRRKLVIFAIISAPLVSVWLEYWMVVRLGNDFELDSIWSSFETIIDMQTSFVTDTGLKIIDSGKHADLKNYFIWIFTLPFPKALFGEIEGSRINYEISEIVLGVSRGAPGFYVVLGGVVAESIYVFGNIFFWIHAVTFGAVGATLLRLISRINTLQILTAWTVIFFSYKMPGGGIGSVLPPLINSNILLYLFIIFATFRFTFSHRQAIKNN